jgi:hypothetical protein
MINELRTDQLWDVYHSKCNFPVTESMSGFLPAPKMEAYQYLPKCQIIIRSLFGFLEAS